MNPSPDPYPKTGNDPNDPIARTLRPLNAVQPSPHLQHRLLAALEDRQAQSIATPRTARIEVLTSWLGPYQLVFSGAALVLCFGLLYAYRESLHPTSKLPNSQLITERTPSTLEQSPTTPKLPNSQLITQRTPPTPTFHISITNIPMRPAAVTQPISAQTALDRTALEDFNARSTLAPPMPPTAQERLVRLMLRSGEKRNLALLDPVQQAAFSRAEQSAVREFFDPPPSPELREALARQAAQMIQPQSSAETQISVPAAQMPDPTVSPKPSGDPQ